MDVSGIRSRRVAYGEQALSKRAGAKAQGSEADGVRPLHVASGTTKGAAAASATRAVQGLAAHRQAASARVSQSLQSSGAPSARAQQDVRTRQPWAGARIDKEGRKKLSNNLLLSNIARHFGKTDPATGGRSLRIPSFPTLWKERASDPAGFEMIAEYASRNQSDVDVAFLRAVDALKKDPSIDGARRLLQNFIEPLPVDDFGMEIPVPGKSVLNMQDGSKRKELLASGAAAIGKAMRSGDAADVQALAGLFDDAASHASGLVRNNLNNLQADLRTYEAAATMKA